MPTDGPMVEPSIFVSVKKALQIPADFTEYDFDVMMHINAALGDVNDLGIGPAEGFMIHDEQAKWVDFLGDNPLYEGAKTLVFMKVRLLFDPPTTGFAITAMEKQIEAQEWRINVRRESVAYTDPDPIPVPGAPDPYDGGESPDSDDDLDFDGGTP